MSRAVAHPNIALVKYWGKRDEALILPAAGSVSLTLDVFPTTTDVTLDPGVDADVVVFDGRPASGAVADRVTAFLDIVRDMACTTTRARVDTRNTVPTGAGLASSASGFAALAAAAADAYGLRLDQRALSRLARRGSGSATRSVVPGLAVWHAGSDDSSSYAEHVDGPALGMLVVVVDASGKKVSSREAMRRTRDTSPYYDAWVRTAGDDVDAMLAALGRRDLDAIGALTESNALRMHAAIAACRPPIRYLAARSLDVFDAAAALRADGLHTYASADAGANVVVVCPDAELGAARDALAERLGVAPRTIVAAHAGRGAHLIDADAATDTPSDVDGRHNRQKEPV